MLLGHAQRAKRGGRYTYIYIYMIGRRLRGTTALEFYCGFVIMQGCTRGNPQVVDVQDWDLR